MTNAADNTVYLESLSCPYCNFSHIDINQWGIRPHKTHLCLNCNEEFESSIKGVSNPVLSPEFRESLDPSKIPLYKNVCLLVYYWHNYKIQYKALVTNNDKIVTRNVKSADELDHYVKKYPPIDKVKIVDQENERLETLKKVFYKHTFEITQ